MRFTDVIHRVIVGLIFIAFGSCIVVAPTRVPAISLAPVCALCVALVGFGIGLKRAARKILHLVLCIVCFGASLALLTDSLVLEREFMDWADTLIVPAVLTVLVLFVSLLARAFLPEGDGRRENA